MQLHHSQRKPLKKEENTGLKKREKGKREEENKKRKRKRKKRKGKEKKMKRKGTIHLLPVGMYVLVKWYRIFFNLFCHGT
jgi:hypothetical protein